MYRTENAESSCSTYMKWNSFHDPSIFGVFQITFLGCVFSKICHEKWWDFLLEKLKLVQIPSWWYLINFFNLAEIFNSNFPPTTTLVQVLLKYSYFAFENSYIHFLQQSIFLQLLAKLW